MTTTVTSRQLLDFCSEAIAHIRTGAPIEPSLWLLLASGDTVVIPGTDWHHYDDHGQWPLLLMTGPDPEWLLQWWMDDVTVGGDDWVAAREVALDRARAATDDQWLQACARAVDTQLAALAEHLDSDTVEVPNG